MSGNAELPPRDEDPLLIDALRRKPQTDVGQLFGQDVVQIVDGTAGFPTDLVLDDVDEQRAALHEINKINELDSELEEGE